MITMKSDPIQFPELRGTLGATRFPVFAELKYDGEFNWIEYRDGEAYCVNKYGTIKSRLKMLDEIVAQIQNYATEKLVPIISITFMAEVYAGDGKAGKLYDLLSQKNSGDLRIFVFDIIQINGESLRNTKLIDRKEILGEILPYMQTPWYFEKKDEVEKLFEIMTGSGWEGLVVKPIDSPIVFGPCNWVKMKKKDRTDYRVINVDVTKERIVVEATYPGKAKAIPVGVKAANRYKSNIQVGDWVTIEHQGILESGSLRHPVLIPKKEWK